MRVLRLLALLLLLPVAAPAETVTNAWPPFDEADSDPSFKAYRDKLLAAIDKRDVAAVVAMADPNIKLSFGDDSGRERFREWLTGADAEPYWTALKRVVSEGGKFEETGMFVAPWAFHYMPPEDSDFYNVAVVAGTKVRLRAAPSTDAAILRELSYAVVEVPPWQEGREDRVTDGSGREWIRVQVLDDRKEGWIASTYMRFLIDYRAGFVKTDTGEWQMTFFLAGD